MLLPKLPQKLLFPFKVVKIDPKIIISLFFTKVKYKSTIHTQYARRTTAEQEVLALIAPLAKLGRFEAAVDFFSNLMYYN